ncbi:MAG: hypothetical protein KJ674_01700 [Nanoarchaeota archaeon]|nr:hypothetical protein [Nanoarchaeota archaeon]
MGDSEINASFYVVASFILLFFVFMFISPEPEPTGQAVGSLLGEGSSSLIIIVVIFVVLILALGVAYFVYKKLKKKKISEDVPLPKKESKEKDVLEGIAEHRADLSGMEVDKLFSTEEKEEKKEIAKPAEKKILTNLGELKTTIVNLLRQRYSKQQILNLLESKGWTLEQVEKAIEDLNLDNLKRYVANSLKEGFNKETIKQSLLRSGWNVDLVNKAIN